jgi:hypothetical protein
MRASIRVRVAAAAFLLLLSPPAVAYLDPSTGSMVVSAIVGIFAPIALAEKTCWYRIKGFFRRGDTPDFSLQESPEQGDFVAGGSFFSGWKGWRQFKKLPWEWRKIIVDSEGGQHWHQFLGLKKALNGRLGRKTTYVTSEASDPGLQPVHYNYRSVLIPGPGPMQT